jgi:hypothetical protein
MASASIAPAHSDSLGPLLVRLSDDFQNLKLRVDRAGALSGLPWAGFNGHQMRVLGSILERGRDSIVRRLESMGDPNPGGDPRGTDPSPMGRQFDPAEFMAEYRGCCRRLCAALREARRVSDAATGAFLSDLALRLEKQLWLMDPRPGDSEVNCCRSVLLFLAC